LKLQKVHLALLHVNSPEMPAMVSEDAYTNSFKHLQRKKESLVARTLLNDLCQIVFGSSLLSLNFRKSPLGQPLLDTGYCSISHSNGWVFVAVSDSPVGVDIEQLEQREIEALSVAFDGATWEKIQGDAFRILQAFSEKEAVSKLRGTGFTEDPKTIKPTTSEHLHVVKVEITENESYIFSVGTPLNAELNFVKCDKNTRLVSLK